MSFQEDKSAVGISEGIKFQWIVLIVGAAICIMKFVAYIITSSVSILTDAVDSIVNVIAALVGLIALYISAKPKDHDHPFGYGHVQLISSTFEGGLISAAGAFIIFESAMRFFNPEELTEVGTGVVIILISMIANLLVGLGAINRGKKCNSHALIASGKHLCTDSLSSFGIFVGLLLILILEHFFNINAYWIDSAIALLVGVIIFYVGINVVHRSISDSMGKVDSKIIENITNTLNKQRHDYCIDIHNVRVMKIGPVFHADLHAVFPGPMTVDEQQNEIRKIIDSFRESDSVSIDVTVMTISCEGKYCRNCRYNCNQRTEPFVEIKEWTIDSISSLIEEKEHH